MAHADVLFLSKRGPWPLNQGFRLGGHHRLPTLVRRGLRNIAFHATDSAIDALARRGERRRALRPR